MCTRKQTIFWRMGKWVGAWTHFLYVFLSIYCPIFGHCDTIFLPINLRLENLKIELPKI